MPTCDRAVRIPMNLGIVMGVQVDIAGSHNLSGSIEHLAAIATIEPADLGDFAVFDPDVGLVAGDAGAVDNHSVFDNGVELSHNSHLLRSAWPRIGQTSRLPGISTTVLNFNLT